MLLPIDIDNLTENIETEDRPIAKGQFNFITECFYMTQKSLEIGFAQVQEKMTNINQEVARMQQTFVNIQQSGSATPEVMKHINDQMEGEMTKYVIILLKNNLLDIEFFTFPTNYLIIKSKFH